MKYGYGCLGFLALLGILGIVTEERSFLAFFGFAVEAGKAIGLFTDEADIAETLDFFKFHKSES